MLTPGDSDGDLCQTVTPLAVDQMISEISVEAASASRLSDMTSPSDAPADYVRPFMGIAAS